MIAAFGHTERKSTRVLTLRRRKREAEPVAMFLETAAGNSVERRTVRFVGRRTRFVDSQPNTGHEFLTFSRRQLPLNGDRFVIV